MSGHDVRPEPQQPATTSPIESNSDHESAQAKAHRNEAGLRLKLVPGVGPKTFSDLVKHFGSPSEVLQAAPSALREVPGVGPRIVSAIAAAPDDDTILESLHND